MTIVNQVREIRKGQFVVDFLCDYCHSETSERKSHFDRKSRHFCNQGCYSKFRAARLSKEEQHRFGTGFSEEERSKRAKCRSDTNHAIRDGLIGRSPCEVCGTVDAEAHHDDYDRPLEVRWLCFEHHRQWHNENPELLEVEL